ncbi:hypothetical protein IVB18_49390 (plasmid) [Bradyrhizobium sp. 186]|uniref:hypothetical protein n=1 Tax=Bradyrhizobium sp. 186 TaxID=2782654 RepID=UPI002001371C|nr:hypothetical protein [Bradyrhizobium sp. 186]UPK40947.1 hypothetical protein IVB18_49390 [Bradyrhizobium sp. 186]
MIRCFAAIIVLWVVSVHAAPAAVPDRSGDALDAGLLDDARLGGPVLTSPPPSLTSVRVAPSPAPTPRPLSANPLWGIPLKTLSNARDRPVFSPSRRPPPAVVAEPEVSKPSPPLPRKTAIEPPPLSLVGTIAGDDESFGIFLDQSTKAALRLKVGDDFQGWKLRTINGREVTMEKDDQGALLTLPRPGSEDSGDVRLVPVSTENKPLAARH